MSKFFTLFSLSFCFLTASLVSANTTDNPPPRCRPEKSWRTVDNWQMKPGEDAMMAGLVSYGPLAFAAGLASDGTTGYWVVRRSLNFGNTWSTIHATKDAAGRGLAVDPRNGHLYTIGFMPVSGQNSMWVVRKSTNGGITWTTIDSYFPTEDPHSHSYIVTRIGVDGRGNVIVIGYDGQDNSRPLMRRSEDGGSTWSNITYTESSFHGATVVASTDGQVLIGGAMRSDSSGGSSRWSVLHSPNGKNNWTEVDSFSLRPTNPAAGSVASAGIIKSDGTILFAGGANLGFEGSGNLIVRKGHLSRLTSWTTIDAYQPFSFSEGFGSAWALGITHGRFGRIFTNGRERTAGSDVMASITRQGNIEPGSFVRSDRLLDPNALSSQYEFVYSGGMATLENWQVLAGFVQEQESSKSWLIRKMSCIL